MKIRSRILDGTLVILATLIILFEEYVWALVRLVAEWLGRFELLRRAEANLRRLPPWGAFAMFAAPILILLPMKVLALVFLAQGRFLSAMLCFVIAKAVGGLVCAWIYKTTRDILLTVPWFAWLSAKAVALRDYAHDMLRNHPAWMAARNLIRAMRGKIAALRANLGAEKSALLTRGKAALRLLRTLWRKTSEGEK